MATTGLSTSEDPGIPQSIDSSLLPLDSLTNLDADVPTTLEEKGDVDEVKLFVP
jgi:hypothetical protein